MTGNRGGAREGAGRHKIDPRLKKIAVGYKLPRWLVEWLRDHRAGDKTSAAVLIEDALTAHYGLTPPGKPE